METGERAISPATLAPRELRVTVSHLADGDIAKARGHYAADHPVRQIRADLRGAARPAGIWPPPSASPPRRSAGSRLGLRPTILLRCGQSQFMI